MYRLCTIFWLAEPCSKHGRIKLRRYQAAKLANKELLKLYYSVGGYVSAHSREGYWGSNAIETIAKALQQELPGVVY